MIIKIFEIFQEGKVAPPPGFPMAPPRPSSSSTNGNYQRYESKMSPHGQPLPGLIKSSPLSDESPSERLSQSNDKLCLIRNIKICIVKWL